MTWVTYRKGAAYGDGFSFQELADRFGTPTYIYSAQQVQESLGLLGRAFADLPVQVFYAVKANANGALLRLLGRAGLGAEVVSGGELVRARKAGFPPDQIVFTGVGKTSQEIGLALEQGIRALIVESLPELQEVARVARNRGVQAPVGLRVNPALDPKTHPHLATGKGGSKFGLELSQVEQALAYIRSDSSVSFVGFHLHLGSQIEQVALYRVAWELLLDLWQLAQRRELNPQFLDLGGGFAVPYLAGSPFPLEELAAVLRGRVPEGCVVLVEPGRFIVAEAGVLLTRVLYVKEVHGRTLVVVDAGMNDFLRPALYGARHPIWPVQRRPGSPRRVDLVGPVCENADLLAQEVELPPLVSGDLLVVGKAGAYGFAMSSQYNSRPRPAEVLLLEGEAYLVRERETVPDLWHKEEVPPCLAG